ncbi:MAG: transposase [Opitutales bacterium]
MRHRRLKVDSGCSSAVYHCMSRTVNGERLFDDREKEVLRKMLWQVADFSGVKVLTYALMENHFHVLIEVPQRRVISDGELIRRWHRLYPRPTKYETASLKVMKRILADGGDRAEAVRERLLLRMGDISEFMKTLKQRFSTWFNKTHERFGPLWSDRFKSVLVEGQGNPLQTIAAYIDLNPVRAGIVDDPKDYRFCGYAEAVAGSGSGLSGGNEKEGQKFESGLTHPAVEGLRSIWRAYANGIPGEVLSGEMALSMHRELIFGKHAGRAVLSEAERAKALKILESGEANLPRATVLRCRVRYFTDGAILGSENFVKAFVETVRQKKRRKRPPKLSWLRGADWGGLATLHDVRRRVFG